MVAPWIYFLRTKFKFFTYSLLQSEDEASCMNSASEGDDDEDDDSDWEDEEDYDISSSRNDHQHLTKNP